MANMTDYLRWRGDLTLGERPFNDVDALVLATLSYLDFSQVIAQSGEGGLALSEAARRLLDLAGDNLAPYVRSLASLDVNFLKELGASRRFGDASIRDMQDVTDLARSLQFAVMCLDLPGEYTYVSFRGTDSSLVGWREDFMLSFTITEAQLLAARYLADVLRDACEKGRRVVVGGHSKGGNLAAYAVASCPDDLLPAIAAAYCFDGPGLDQAITPRGAYDRLGERYRRIQPEYSVVGALFDREEEPRAYLASSASGFMQHDPLTWQIMGQEFVEAKCQAQDARVFATAVSTWLAETRLDEREAFTQELFDILSSGGATTLEGVFQVPGVQQVLAAASSASEKVKGLASRMVALMWQGALDAIKSAAREGTTDLVKSVVASASEHTTSRLPPIGLP